MKPGWQAAAAINVLLAATVGWGQSATERLKFGDLQVQGVSVVEIDTSHVQVKVDSTLTPTQSVTLKSVQLCSLHLNGMPVFAAPLDEVIVLRKGMPMVLPPIYVSVLFRDVTTVEPLRRMIEKQSVRVQSELVADLQLNFLEKLALRAQHPRAEIAVDEEVPANIGGSYVEQKAALALLVAIQGGLDAKAMVGTFLPGMGPAWTRDLAARADESLYAVESSYTLRRKDARYPVVLEELGFRVESGEVVTAAETREPWKYDADFMTAIQSGAASLEKDGREISLRPMESSSGILKLSANDFTVENRGTAGAENVTATGWRHKQVPVLKRASPGSMEVLSLRSAPVSVGFHVAPADVAAQDSWEHVAVFRLRVNPDTRERSVEMLQLGASREGNGIRLTEPVDSAVFGSPIVTEDGVIGLVQDEQVGTFLALH
jgi:hypothetical protein